ncbi:MAG: hypothetical protein PHP02_05085 [Eubacteriales bacterium]|nr:hypothetical protein [Eubacteriales bacterium]
MPALAQHGRAVMVVPVNPEDYPYFLVMDVAQAEAGSLPVIVITGCFGDFRMEGADGESNPGFLGFDEENPVQLELAETYEALLPEDFSNNIMANFPQEDILGWWARQTEEYAPLTFFAVVTLNELNQITGLEYQYFPWG